MQYTHIFAKKKRALACVYAMDAHGRPFFGFHKFRLSKKGLRTPRWPFRNFVYQ